MCTSLNSAFISCFTPEHVSVYSDGNSTEADLLNRMNSSGNNNEPKQRKYRIKFPGA
jgi:hypothetical protein